MRTGELFPGTPNGLFGAPRFPMDHSTLTLEFPLHIKEGRQRKKRIAPGIAPEVFPTIPGNIPRISRLLALAIHLEGLVRDGHISNYSTLARLSHVSRPRITQIMNLNNLAPDIQEEILFLPRTIHGKDLITEHTVRLISGLANWGDQRERWGEIVSSSTYCSRV